MKLKGTPVSGGYAVGKIYSYQPRASEVADSFISRAEAEKAVSDFERAREQAKAELEKVCDRLNRLQDEKAKIFRAHIDILYDVAIAEDVYELIGEELYSPAHAVRTVFDKYIRILKGGRSAIISERADDLKDVCFRLLQCLGSAVRSDLSLLDTPIILTVHDLLPSDTADLDPEKVLAILAEEGGPTSHSAIIAKSYGIPAVLGIRDLSAQVRDGMTAAVDAFAGTVEIAPDPQEEKRYRELAERMHKKKECLRERKTQPCFTKDGVHIDMNLNIGRGTAEELEAGSYLDGIGLFRTEFLFMGRDQLPSEDEQFAIYRRVLSAYGEKTVTLRTLDIGCDKQTDCLEQPAEPNPALGRRALRLCFAQPELFKTQIRAALRASLYGNLWLMLPMVGSMEDIDLAKRYLREAEEELKQAGHACDRNYKFGVMIEIPSIALLSDLVAKEVDFASIGSNDLCQYTLAADRLSPEVSEYYRPWNPALIRLMKYAIDQFTLAGKPISVCGEMGGDPMTATLLVGLGLRKLSMGIASIAEVKDCISGIALSRAEEIASRVLLARTADEAEAIVKNAIQNTEA